MEFSKKDIAIFYVKKNKGVFYSKAFPSADELSFPKDTIDNLEVVDKEKLSELIKSYLSAADVKPTSIIILLDRSITFGEKIENTAASLELAEVERFADIVPFHQVLSKTFKINNESKIVAVNGDLCRELVNIFKEESINVIGVVPMAILEKVIPGLKKDFNIKKILGKVHLVKQYSMLYLPDQGIVITRTKPKFKSFQFVFLIGIFVILLFILFFIVYLQFFKK